MKRANVDGIRVYGGEFLTLRSLSSIANTIQAFGTVEYDDGSVADITLGPMTNNADRTTVVTSSAYDFTRSGTITKLVADQASTVARRGQLWVSAVIRKRSHGRPVGLVFQGYAEAEPGPSMGDFDHWSQGKGYLDWIQEADDAAGNATTTVNLAVINTRRVVRAVIIKYHSSSDVATRTLTITLRDLATATGPTGWSNDSDTWISPTLTLTADEEGLIHVGEHGFVSTNDDGTLAYADNSSAPNPFPLTLEEGETADLIIAAGAGEAADDYDVLVQYEEWLEP